MKFIVNRVLVALLLVTLAGTAAYAKTRNATVSFDAVTKVNGTLVKSGTYNVVFDEQTGELSVLKGGKVIAKTATRLEKREGKARHTEVQTINEGMAIELVSIAFNGSDQNVVVSRAGMQAGGN